MFACQSEADFSSASDLSSDDVPEIENDIELSHTPTGKVRIAASDIEIDFSCDEYMAANILSGYGQLATDSAHTRGELIRFYEARRPVFEYGYSSYRNPYGDDDYVFPKLEYMLAQECLQDNCSSQTRKVILRIAIDKQKQKYDEYKDAYTARRTGLFLMAVILTGENDAAFTSAVHTYTDLQSALLLSIDIPPDKEFSDAMIQYAESFLYNNI
jgi:hypothetical protein